MQTLPFPLQWPKDQEILKIVISPDKNSKFHCKKTNLDFSSTRCSNVRASLVKEYLVSIFNPKKPGVHSSPQCHGRHSHSWVFGLYRLTGNKSFCYYLTCCSRAMYSINCSWAGSTVQWLAYHQCMTETVITCSGFPYSKSPSFSDLLSLPTIKKVGLIDILVSRCKYKFETFIKQFKYGLV